MELSKARPYAERIVSALEPYCEKIEIAGSIRRGRPHVADIDLAILPKPGKFDVIKERCLKSATLITDGPQIFTVRLFGGIQLDIFFARGPVPDLIAPKPGNWGSILLCRTGSKDHNIWLVQKAWPHGCRWLPYEGVQRDGRIIAGETEEEIFTAIGLDFIPPEGRER
jgi:DNA polymerase (family X)